MKVTIYLRTIMKEIFISNLMPIIIKLAAIS